MRNLIFLFLGVFLAIVQSVNAQNCSVGEEKLVFNVDANGNFDAYAFSWSLSDANGTEIISYREGAYSDFTITVDSVCLRTGQEYTFRAFNSFGGSWNGSLTSFVSIYYPTDQFPLYDDSPDNGNFEIGIPETEFSFVVGEKPGLDCLQPKAISIYESLSLNTRFFNTNTAFSTLDSGKDAILSFTPPSNDTYTFAVNNVSTPTNVSLQLLSDCLSGTPSLLGSGASSISQEPFSFNAALSAGTTYYLLFSNDIAAGAGDTAQAKLEITYSGPPLADACFAVTETMDGAPFVGRFAGATNSGAQISFTTREGNFYQSALEDIIYDFVVLDSNVVVEVTGYPENAELYGQISFGGCPGGSVNLRNASFEGTTRRLDFGVSTFDVGSTASLRLAGDQVQQVNQPFTIRIRSRSNVESEFPTNPNDDCVTALSLNVNSLDDYFQGSYAKPTQLSNYGATNSGLLAPCGQDSIYTGTTADVWAKVMIPQSGIISVTADGEVVEAGQKEPLNIAWSIYTGTCGSLSEYYCSPNLGAYQADSVGGFIPGEEVYIRLFDRGGLRSGDFSVSIQELGRLAQPSVGFLTYNESIDVQFFQEQFDFDNYLLDVSIDSFTTFLPGYESVFLNKNTSAFSVTGLQPNRTYYIRVKKVSASLGDSEYFSDVVKTEPYVINSIASGSWNDPSIWAGSVVPPADSAVHIFHRVVVPQGTNITIEDVTISNSQLTVNTIGLFVQNANFTVKRDIDVLEFGSVTAIDSLGVFITNSLGISSTFSVDGAVRLIADYGSETQFMFYAQNSSGNLTINVGQEFLFRNVNTFGLTENPENILFDNVVYNGQFMNLEHQDDVNSQTQSFKATFNNSIVNLSGDLLITETTGDFTTVNPFDILFTGNTSLNLGGSFNKPYGGAIKFLNASTLELNGTDFQYISTFDPGIGQDSTIIRNLIINNSSGVGADNPNSALIDPGVYFNANSSSGFGQILIDGQVNFTNGVASTFGGFDNTSVQVILSETATLDPAYDGNNNSYFMGYLTKVGLADFTYPIGNEFGPRILTVSGLTSTASDLAVTLGSFSNACQDSVFSAIGGISRNRDEEYWSMKVPGLLEAGITAQLTAEFPNLADQGISDLAALRLLDYTNSVDLGNLSNTASSFTASYNFDNGLDQVFGLGTVINANIFYDPLTVNSVSTNNVAPGEQIVITYNSNFASINDVVYFEEIPATTTAASPNTITVTVPDGARTSEPVILLENNKIIYVNAMVNVREATLKSIIGQNYDSIVVMSNIGPALFGASKLALSDLNENGDYDVVALRQAVDSLYFIQDLASTQTYDFFNFATLEPGERPYFRDINPELSNLFNTPSVDLATYVQYFNQNIQVYLQNDGLGNFIMAETEGFGSTPKVASPFIRDLNGDGFSDFNFLLKANELNYSGVYSSAMEQNQLCSLYDLQSLYTRADKLAINDVKYASFGETNIVLSFAYTASTGELVLSNPNQNINSNLGILSVASSLRDFQVGSVNGNASAQLLALDTVGNSIEVFNGLNDGSITNVSLPLAYSPGRMAIEDLNGDGFSDIIVSERSTATLYFYQNDGAGNFVLADTKISVISNIVDLAIADVDKDGNRDIVLLSENGDVSVAYYVYRSLEPPVVTLAALDANRLELTVNPVVGADLYDLVISLDADSLLNQVTDTVLSVTDGVYTFLVPEYSEIYYVYARSIAAGIDTSNYAGNVSIKLPVSDYLVRDSTILAKLYDETAGVNWSTQSNWKAGKLNKWAGIVMNADSVKAIELSGFGLQNALPDSLVFMSFLEDLNVANNQLSSLGNIAALSAQLLSANVSNNALSFEELEKLSSVPSFLFANQQHNYYLFPDTVVNLTDNITFDPGVSSANNVYQWYKNNIVIAGATSGTYSLNNVVKLDEGKFHLEITNSLFAGLTLYSDTVDFKVSTLERDIAALKGLYASANGAGWSSVKWDTSQVEPANWNVSATDIIVENNRIVELNLPNNNLVGSVSPLLREMLGLRKIDLSANKLESLPRLKGLPLLTTLNMDANLLGYEDLEPNVNVIGFTFENQALVGASSTSKQAAGTAVSASFNFGGTANTYQWVRNTLPVVGAVQNTISIDSLVYENMGTYQLLVKNTIINAKYPDFTLRSGTSGILATANITGLVTDANAFPTSSGLLSLFGITATGSYDTVLFANSAPNLALGGDGSFVLEDIVLGDYILFVRPNKTNFPNLLPTYFENTIDWDLAATINLRMNVDNLDVIMEGTPQALVGTSLFKGYVEREVPEASNGRFLPRRRVKGAGVSVRRVGNSTRGISVFNGELVGFVETDENGEFAIENLPPGEYICKVDYPGIPMDQSSDIQFTFTGENLESLEVAAVVDNGLCRMETIKYTATNKVLEQQYSVFPNPFADKFSIQGELSEVTGISVYNVNGQLMHQANLLDQLPLEIIVDLSHFTSGIYILKIDWKNGFSASSKIIKK